MEGLEISEILKSELERTARIDSEFYAKENLRSLEVIDRKTPESLTEFLNVSDGNHMSISEHFTKNAIPYYRGGDIYNFFIEQTPDPLNIPEFVYAWPHMKRSHLQKGDVLISIVGAIIGNLSLVKTDNKATCSCKLAILRPKNIEPEFAAIFLKSKYGQNQIKKFRRGSGQTGLILEDFDQLLVPTLNARFRKSIKKIVDLAFEKLDSSIKKYTQAENLLLETLGLKDFKPSQEAANIKSFKDSFETTGRLDAEYYQLKYEDYIKLISSYSNGFELLNNVCQIKDANFNPSKKEEYKYIELSNIGKSGEVTGCTINLGSELPTRARRKISTKDVIISSIEGSLESCALITKEYNNALCSTGFYVITSEILNPETLLVLFKSEPMQNILKKGCSGTILTAIGKPELEKIPIPKIKPEIQVQIQAKVIKSFQLKAQSEQLLETAKRAVEIAIEESEEVALEFIEQKLKEIE